MNSSSFLMQHAAKILAISLGLIAYSSSAQVNDLFGNRIAISGTNIVVAGSNVEATLEMGEEYWGGFGTIWWSWTAPCNGLTSISTAGSGFDTVLSVHTGSSVNDLTHVANNDDEDNVHGIYTSKVFFYAAAGQTYQIAASGYRAEQGTIVLDLQLPPAPAWTMLNTSGATLRSANFAGKVIILHFWGTWNADSKTQIPDLVALQNKYRTDGLVVIGAAVETNSTFSEAQQAVKNFAATNSLSINYQLLMADDATREAYGNIGVTTLPPYGLGLIPITFIIDRQNNIDLIYSGTQTRSNIEQRIIPLLYANTRLNSAKSSNGMVLSWQTNTLNFTLQYSSSLTAPAWTNWPTLPTVVSGTNNVTLPSTNKPRFFRLKLSY